MILTIQRLQPCADGDGYDISAKTRVMVAGGDAGGSGVESPQSILERVSSAINAPPDARLYSIDGSLIEDLRLLYPHERTLLVISAADASVVSKLRADAFRHARTRMTPAAHCELEEHEEPLPKLQRVAAPVPERASLASSRSSVLSSRPASPPRASFEPAAAAPRPSTSAGDAVPGSPEGSVDVDAPEGREELEGVAVRVEIEGEAEEPPARGRGRGRPPHRAASRGRAPLAAREPAPAAEGERRSRGRPRGRPRGSRSAGARERPVPAAAEGVGSRAKPETRFSARKPEGGSVPRAAGPAPPFATAPALPSAAAAAAVARSARRPASAPPSPEPEPSEGEERGRPAASTSSSAQAPVSPARRGRGRPRKPRPEGGAERAPLSPGLAERRAWYFGLYSHWIGRGEPLARFPLAGGRPVDLYRLALEVAEARRRGGDPSWEALAEALGVPPDAEEGSGSELEGAAPAGPASPAGARALRRAFERWVAPYEAARAQRGPPLAIADLRAAAQGEDPTRERFVVCCACGDRHGPPPPTPPRRASPRRPASSSAGPPPPAATPRHLGCAACARRGSLDVEVAVDPEGTLETRAVHEIQCSACFVWLHAPCAVEAGLVSRDRLAAIAAGSGPEGDFLCGTCQAAYAASL